MIKILAYLIFVLSNLVVLYIAGTLDSFNVALAFIFVIATGAMTISIIGSESKK